MFQGLRAPESSTGHVMSGTKDQKRFTKKEQRTVWIFAVLSKRN
jgi:hypothetical protein